MPTNRPDISYSVSRDAVRDMPQAVLTHRASLWPKLSDKGQDIVLCNSISMVELLGEHLPDAATHHSGMDGEEREEPALCFAEGSPRVMRTTSGLSAAVYFPNVDAAIQAGTPYALIDFAQ